MGDEMSNARVAATAPTRPAFPVLGSGGAKIDYQLVTEHGGQAQRNHYQSVKQLADRGGLSWAELHAVLTDRKFCKIDQNKAIAECRAIEARYLAAISQVEAQDFAECQAFLGRYDSGQQGAANAIRAIARPAEEWHEGLGDCLWWCWRDGDWLSEAPYVGSPLDLGHTVECHTHAQSGDSPAARFMVGGWPGYHTHFTELPSQPAAPQGGGEG